VLKISLKVNDLRMHYISRAPLKRQAQGTSLFTSAATHLRVVQGVVQGNCVH